MSETPTAAATALVPRQNVGFNYPRQLAGLGLPPAANEASKSNHLNKKRK